MTNKNKLLKEISTLVLMVVVFVIGLTLGSKLDVHLESEITCEDVQMKIFAFQQCLKYQPACRMNKGVEMFAEYHKNKNWVSANCPGDGSGLQLQNTNE